ncbi:MAG: type II toxin-antitoxin system VapC family toxin, partial [Variovorax sp.]
ALDQQYVSAISWLELEVGILGIERRDPQQGGALRRWADALHRSFADRVRDVDKAVALRAGKLHVPDRMPELDGLIAATALVHGMTLVTRNTRDFQRSGVQLVDPWTGEASAYQ